MHKLALVTAAIFALAPSFAPSSAEARARVTVSPVYVPAVYCSYKSAEWKTKGIVSCPLGWAPEGLPRHEVEDRRWWPDVLEHQHLWRQGV